MKKMNSKKFKLIFNINYKKIILIFSQKNLQ